MSLIDPSVKNIINPLTGSNSTLDFGIGLIDKDPDSQSSIQAKSLGLQLTLLGLAEIQALRVRNLAISTYELERKLYSSEAFEEMDATKLLRTYQALNENLAEAIKYIKDTTSQNWKEIEESVMLLVASEGTPLDGATEEELQEHDQLQSNLKDLLVQVSGMKDINEDEKPESRP